MSAQRVKHTLPMLVLVALCLVAPVSAVAELPDKAAPFTAVRWDGDTPIVRVDGQWYEMQALDHLSSGAIIEFAKEEHGDRWKKRFSEDLVEVLEGMGYAPDVAVTLTIEQHGRTITKAAQMTEENRRSAWQFNQDGQVPGASTTSAPDPISESGSPGGDPHQLARQYAQHIDEIWNEPPEAGKANLRILMTRNGEPYAVQPVLQSEFSFRATGASGLTTTQGFNPNRNGRWVYEGLDPGTYSLRITGNGAFSDWEWNSREFRVAAGKAPLIEIELE